MNFYTKVIPINEGKNALTQKLSVFLNHYRYYENLATAKKYEWKRTTYFIFQNNDIWVLISDHCEYKSNLFVIKNSWAKIRLLFSGYEVVVTPRLSPFFEDETQRLTQGREEFRGGGEHSKDHLQDPQSCDHRTYSVLSLLHPFLPLLSAGHRKMHLPSTEFLTDYGDSFFFGYWNT